MTNLTSSIQVSEEAIEAGCVEAAEWEADARSTPECIKAIYLAMRSKDHSIDDVERVIAEAIASTSEGNGNAVAEAAARIAALVRSKPIDAAQLIANCAFEKMSPPIGDEVRLRNAAQALVDDVRRRYPGEELRCPLMIELDAALTAIGSQSK